jgi:hypothetical protein
MAEDGHSRSESGFAGLTMSALRPYLTGETARELFATVDIEAVLAGRTVEEAIEREHAGAVLGRALGRALSEERRANGRLQALAIRFTGERVGAHLGRAATATLLEEGLLTTLIDDLRMMSTDPGVHRLLDELETATARDARSDPDFAPESPPHEKPSERGDSPSATDVDRPDHTDRRDRPY